MHHQKHGNVFCRSLILYNIRYVTSIVYCSIWIIYGNMNYMYISDSIDKTILVKILTQYINNKIICLLAVISNTLMHAYIQYMLLGANHFRHLVCGRLALSRIATQPSAPLSRCRTSLGPVSGTQLGRILLWTTPLTRPPVWRCQLPTCPIAYGCRGTPCCRRNYEGGLSTEAGKLCRRRIEACK